MNTSGRDQGGGSRPQVNGNREQTNNFLLDGVDNNDSIDNRIGYQPNVDALQEVQVITGNGSSEFGNVGGAIVNTTLKSGTNQYHGNVFEFLRNNKLDANGFFGNRARTTRNPLQAEHIRRHFRRPGEKERAVLFRRLRADRAARLRRGEGQRGSGSMADRRLSDFLRISKQVVKDP